MKPTKRLPILARHVSRTMEFDGVVQPLITLFPQKVWDNLSTEVIDGKRYAKQGFEVIDVYKKEPVRKVKTPPEADEKVQNKTATAKDTPSNGGTVEDNPKQSEAKGASSGSDGGKASRGTARVKKEK